MKPSEVVKGIKKNHIIQETIQFIYMQNKLDIDLINCILIDSSLPCLPYTKELVFNVGEIKVFWNLLSWFSKHNKLLVLKNCPNLKRVGVYFDYWFRNAFKQEYLSTHSDYNKVTFKHKWYFIFKDADKVTTYKAVFNKYSEIYWSHIEYDIRSNRLQLNFIKFVSWLPFITAERK